MFNHSKNVRAVENFIVAKRGTTVYNTAGNHINTSNGNILLADGQLGFFDATGMATSKINLSLAAGTTVAQSPAIQIVQGTEDSAQPWATTKKYPLVAVPFETTGAIFGNKIVSVTKENFKTPTHSTWVIGKATGVAGAISAARLTEYSLQLGFRGRRMEEFYSAEEAYFVSPNYITPDYTALSTSKPVDDLLQNLAWDINLNTSAFQLGSRYKGHAPVVALLADSTGSAGTIIDNLSTSTFLPIANTKTGLKGMYLTAAMIASIKSAATQSGLDTAVATILTNDLASAGTTTGGIADVLILLALDAKLAFKDYGTSVKNTITVTLTRGFNFNTVYHKELVRAFEGQGSGFVWDRLYKNTQGQRKYNLIHVEDPIIEFPSPIDPTDSYTVYTIEHTNPQSVDTFNTIENRKKDFILVPTGTKGVVDSSNTAQMTAVEAFLNPYLASAGKSNVVNFTA